MELEKAVVRKARRGNDEAFLFIINTIKLDLYKTAYAYLHNREDALEAVQEVTVRIYQEIKKLRKEAFFKTWAIKIMINYCNDVLRKRKHTVLNDELVHVSGKADSYTLLEIEDAMNQLDQRSREILTLKYFHDMKLKDIAITLECPEGTVKTWLNKALKSLRKLLDEKGGMSHV
ncbi:sigma-70 family RNA polymerase sigma factor [Cytobacillus gottheilii]|uniref:sigma-70 family RNA polymerase sigma factor n=1 Tax=Cytobacillus gottheilii TaxID=859144 RepID=UPI00082A63B7|nr:sigma-70 family RNA polymerase sigma factor [Cytobacillus gottheilii]